MPDEARALNIYRSISDVHRASKNYTRALYWNSKALKQHGMKGKGEHLQQLAEAYKLGLGVEKNVAKAEYYYRKRAQFDKSTDEGRTNLEVSKLCCLQGKVAETVRQISIAAKLDNPVAVEQEMKIRTFITTVLSAEATEQISSTQLTFE